ncbi:MAG: ABC-F family ATP-binding cassette domain-containing protein [Clostridiales bacterium]|nr:ABC-F family ATP-binding cassette domain-containing protein [Clostridiales bacterium]
MNILTLEDITKSFTERKLLDQASFYLQEGEKVGIIGVNGTGKTTLLKLMAGLEEPEEGRIVRANHAMVRYLPQHPDFKEDETILESVVRFNRTRENEWSIEKDAKAMLTKLGVTDFDALCGTLSGGQKKRLALVSVLLSPAEILVLDEPTNHLDSEMADWLEETLKRRKGALVMVTHDRYFLDSVTDRIVEIDKGKLYSYETNYSGYLELRANRLEMEAASERKRQSILRKELAWVQRGARARTTKQKGRLERYEELKNRTAPEKESTVEFGSVASRLGKTTVELSHIRKAYGDRVLIDDFSYIFLKNDRIGFLGRNGCGKTTLMKILSGQLAPDAGEIKVGETVKIGYYAQEIQDAVGKGEDAVYRMDPEQRVIDYVRDVAEYVQTQDGSITASQMLERFLFSGEAQYGKIGKLSGGEKRRLNLLRVLMMAPNVLILDEPTNDLDIVTLQILEDYLDLFPGIVITVSHDRFFLDRTVRRIFAFEENGKLCQYEGGYTDYVFKRMEKAEAANETARNTVKAQNGKASSEKKEKPRERKLKFTYKEQRDYDTIEAELQELEEKLVSLDAQMLSAARDFVKLNELTKEKDEILKLQEEKLERWMYLEELAAQIAAMKG